MYPHLMDMTTFTLQKLYVGCVRSFISVNITATMKNLIPKYINAIKIILLANINQKKQKKR
jgi:hypothetical protein